VRNRVRQTYGNGNGVFLNIPYSNRYSSFEVAIISTVTAYGLTPRMARQRVGLEIRAQKIFELILSCRYGVTDLSYQKRMNMPLELGLLLALGKETFVITGRKYAALKSISDLNFGDVYHHGGSVRNLILRLSQWIEQTCSKTHLATESLLQRYRRTLRVHRQLGPDFDRHLPDIISGLLLVAEDEFRMPGGLVKKNRARPITKRRGSAKGSWGVVANSRLRAGRRR
jgi:hypothetical protein